MWTKVTKKLSRVGNIKFECVPVLNATKTNVSLNCTVEIPLANFKLSVGSVLTVEGPPKGQDQMEGTRSNLNDMLSYQPFSTEGGAAGAATGGAAGAAAGGAAGAAAGGATGGAAGGGDVIPDQPFSGPPNGAGGVVPDHGCICHGCSSTSGLCPVSSRSGGDRPSPLQCLFPGCAEDFFDKCLECNVKDMTFCKSHLAHDVHEHYSTLSTVDNVPQCNSKPSSRLFAEVNTNSPAPVTPITSCAQAISAAVSNKSVSAPTTGGSNNRNTSLEASNSSTPTTTTDHTTGSLTSTVVQKSNALIPRNIDPKDFVYLKRFDTPENTLEDFMGYVMKFAAEIVGVEDNLEQLCFEYFTYGVHCGEVEKAGGWVKYFGVFNAQVRASVLEKLTHGVVHKFVVDRDLAIDVENLSPKQIRKKVRTGFPIESKDLDLLIKAIHNTDVKRVDQIVNRLAQTVAVMHAEMTQKPPLQQSKKLQKKLAANVELLKRDGHFQNMVLLSDEMDIAEVAASCEETNWAYNRRQFGSQPPIEHNSELRAIPEVKYHGTDCRSTKKWKRKQADQKVKDPFLSLEDDLDHMNLDSTKKSKKRHVELDGEDNGEEGEDEEQDCATAQKKRRISGGETDASGQTDSDGDDEEGVYANAKLIRFVATL